MPKLKEPPTSTRRRNPGVSTKTSRMQAILDREKTPEWLRLVVELQLWAISEANAHERKQVFPVIGETLGGVAEICDFLDYFGNSPRRAVEGERGVAKQLKLSKTAVNNRIRRLGLSADDFREPQATLNSLFKKSEFIKSRMSKVRRLYRKYCL